MLMYLWHKQNKIRLIIFRPDFELLRYNDKDKLFIFRIYPIMNICIAFFKLKHGVLFQYLFLKTCLINNWKNAVKLFRTILLKQNKMQLFTLGVGILPSYDVNELLILLFGCQHLFCVFSTIHLFCVIFIFKCANFIISGKVLKKISMCIFLKQIKCNDYI